MWGVGREGGGMQQYNNNNNNQRKKRGREVNYDDGRILEEIFWNVCTRHDCYAMYNTEATGWLVGFEFWLLCFSIQTKRRRNALA